MQRLDSSEFISKDKVVKSMNWWINFAREIRADYRSNIKTGKSKRLQEEQFIVALEKAIVLGSLLNYTRGEILKMLDSI